jgi:methyl-accepting chemotaxis protein
MMRSVASKTFIALAAAAAPAVMVAGLLGLSLISIVDRTEADVNSAMSASRWLADVRVMIEKEYGLVARLPAELDLGKVERYKLEIAATAGKIDAAISEIAQNERIVLASTAEQVQELRAASRKISADIFAATASFAQSTALELVNGPFESNTSTVVKLLDGIGSNVDAVAQETRSSLRASADWAWRLTTIALLTAAISVAAGLWMMRQQVIAPLATISGGMRRLAEDDLAVETSGWPKTGDLGEMTRAVERFKQNARARDDLQKERLGDLEAAQTRNRHLAALAKQFRSDAETMINHVTSASGLLKMSSQTMAAAASDSEKRAQEVATATECAQADASDVAAASADMTKTIAFAAEQIMTAKAVAAEANTGARGACQTMEGVVESTRAISTVIELINRITSETNLLALNATIEAARAGETGRGFGVVASEVKNLADATAKATGQVAEQIRALQAASDCSSVAIDQVAKVIARMDEIALAVSTVMDKQSTTTGEISRSAQSAASGTKHVLESIVGVQEASQRTRGISDEVGRAASDLAMQADGLSRTVQRFLQDLAAA